MSFTKEEKEKAQQTINIGTLNGNLGDIESLGNLSTGNNAQNTTTINNSLNENIDDLIKKINSLDISDKKEIIDKINENKENKKELVKILVNLMSRGAEIITIAPAIGALVGLLG
jgi:uncharacterized coiled-coil DUF342 family protein